MTVHAHPRFLIVTDAAVLVLVEALLVAIRSARVLVSPLAFWMLSATLVLGLAADVAAWFWRGVRTVTVEDELLTIYRGWELRPRTFARRDLVRLEVRRFPGAARVKLRAASGPRVVIREQAFPREEFARFLSVLETWRP